MNKQELIDAVASEVGITKSAAAETIDAFLATVTNAVVKGDPVQLIGFGSFSTGARSERAMIRSLHADGIERRSAVKWKNLRLLDDQLF